MTQDQGAVCAKPIGTGVLPKRTNVTAELLGDPSPKRSALNNWEPWQPVYDSEPVVVEHHNGYNLSSNQLPTEQQITAAITTAAAIVGVSAGAVATGTSALQDKRLSHARFYAGYALLEVFPYSQKKALALAIGVKKSYAPVFLSKPFGKWLKQAELKKVIAAIKATA